MSRVPEDDSRLPRAFSGITVQLHSLLSENLRCKCCQARSRQRENICVKDLIPQGLDPLVFDVFDKLNILIYVRRIVRFPPYPSEPFLLAQHSSIHVHQHFGPPNNSCQNLAVALLRQIGNEEQIALQFQMGQRQEEVHGDRKCCAVVQHIRRELRGKRYAQGFNGGEGAFANDFFEVLPEIELLYGASDGEVGVVTDSKAAPMFITEEFDMNMQGWEIHEDELGKDATEEIVVLEVPFHKQFKAKVADTWQVECLWRQIFHETNRRKIQGHADVLKRRTRWEEERGVCAT